MSRIEEVIKAILGEGEITSDLISRLEKIFEAIYEDGMYKGYTLGRSEEIVLAILKGERYDGPAIGRIEQILKAIANDGHYDSPVISRVEELLIKWFTEYHKVVEFTGEFPATIRSTGNDIVNYRIYGNTVQDGEPSPDNPVDVVGCGVRTVNLAPPVEEWADGYVNSIDGGLWLPSSVHKEKTSDFIKVEPARYYFTTTVTNATAEFWTAIGIYDKEKNFINRASTIGGTSISLDLTSQPLAAYIRLSFRTYSKDAKAMLVEGTTPPDHYIPYGYKFPVVTSGVNLAPPVEEWRDGYITASGTVSSPSAFEEKISDFIKVTPESYYFETFFNPNDVPWIGVGLYDKEKKFITRLVINTNVSRTGLLIQPSGYEAANYLRLSFRTYGESVKAMLVKGSTSPPQYEPYHPPITTDIYLGSEPLHKIGDYADYVDFERGVVGRNVKKLVLTGEESWSIYKLGETTNIYNIRDIFAQETTEKNRKVLSNKYPHTYSTAVDGQVHICRVTSGLYIEDDHTPIADFKSYLADQYANGTPVIVWYVLRTSEDETPPVPFPKIPTVDGTTIIDVPEDLYPRPSKVELEYYGDLYMTADNKLYRMPNGEFLGG